MAFLATVTRASVGITQSRLRRIAIAPGGPGDVAIVNTHSNNCSNFTLLNTRLASFLRIALLSGGRVNARNANRSFAIYNLVRFRSVVPKTRPEMSEND